MGKEIYRQRLLIFGIATTCFAISRLPIIWTFKSSLIPLHGTIATAKVHTETVTDNRGHRSHVSELTFYLNEFNKKFYLAENIGNDYSNKEHELIRKGLVNADSVTVWIKKNESDEYQPKIFQIDRDRNIILLEFQRVRTSESPLTAFLLVIGLGSIVFFLWLKYPEKFKKIFE